MLGVLIAFGMAGSFGVIGIIIVVYHLVKEKLEKPAPEGTRFDWDAYWKDVHNGISCMAQIKKQERGGYWTTEPLPEKRVIDAPIPDDVVDVETYKHDREIFGEENVEKFRKCGLYSHMKTYPNR